MKSSFNPFLRTAVRFAAIACCFGAEFGTAATIEWSSTAASSLWTDGTNWVGGTAPVNNTTTDSARFSQSSYVSQPNYGTASVGQLAFGNGTAPSAAVTLSGVTLTIGNSSAIVVNANAGAATINGTNPLVLVTSSITNNSSSLLTIGAGVRSSGLGGTSTITFTGSGPITMTGPVNNGTGANSVAVSKSGACVLTLAASNAFKGGLTLSGATAGSQLNLNHAGALGSGTLTISSGDNAKIDNTSGAAITLSTNNAQTWTNNFTFVGSNDLNMGTGAISLGGTRTITANAKTLTLGGVISSGTSAYGLTKAGAGTVALTNANTYNGTTTVNAGVLRISNANALGSTTAATTVASGGSLEISGGITSNPSEAITIAGTGENNIGALRAGTGGGIWAGSVALGNAPRLGATAGNTLTVTGTIANGSGNTFAVSGQSGTGVVVLNPASPNTYTGKTDIVRGTLRNGKTDALPASTILDVDSVGAVSEPAIYDLASFNQTIAGLQDTATTSVNGKVTNSVASSTSVLTMDQSTDTTFDGVIENGAGTVELVKTGIGTLTLNGANTYTGPTSVNNGRLYVGGTMASAVTVASGAAIGGEGTLSNPLTLSAGSSSLYFNPTTPAALTVPSLSADGAAVTVIPTGTLTPGTPCTVLVNSAGFTGDPSALFTPGARGTLAYGGTSNTELQFTPSAALVGPLVWKGDHPTNPTYWDVNTTNNWSNDSSPDVFFTYDAVTFDDTAVSGIVTIQPTQITAGALTFNNSVVDYVVSGGGIAGTSGLTKSGTASLTLSNANTFTGGVTIHAGTVNINHASALGAAANTITFNGGTLDNTSGATVTTGNHPLVLNADLTFTGTNSLGLGAGATNLGTDPGSNTVRTITTTASNLTLSGVVSDGSNVLGIRKLGAGSLTLGGTNTYTGPVTISEGTVVAQNSSAFGTAANGVTVANGATLSLGGTLGTDALNLGTEAFVISGSGVGGAGAIVCSSQQTNAIRNITLAADASFGGTGRWDMRGTGALLDMAGYTLTKTGTGYVALVGTSVSNPGSIDIQQGTFSVQTTTTLGGSSSNTFTVRSGAALDSFVSGTWTSPEWSVVLENGASFSNSNGVATWNSPVSVSGTANLSGGATLTLNGVISGPTGSINKIGAGTVNLAGNDANTYGGSTSVAAGILGLGKPSGVNAVTGDVLVNATGTLTNSNDQQIPDSASVTITDNAAVWNLNGKSETIHTLNVGGTTADNKGFTSGVAGKLTVSVLNLSGSRVTLNSAGAGLESWIEANSVVQTGGSWLMGTASGTQSLRVGSGGLSLSNGSTLNIATASTALSNHVSLGGDVTSQAAATSNVISTSGSNTGELKLNAQRTFTVANGDAASDLTISALVVDGTASSGVVKSGAGTLTFNAANTYTGATTISQGVLALGASGSVANSTGISIAAGAVLDTSAKTTHAIPAAQPVTLTVNAAGSGSSGQILAAGLDITNANVVLNVVGALDDNAYVLASYTSLSGTAFASITPPSGYTVNYAYNPTSNGAQIALVKSGGFGAWASENGVTGGPGGDHDGDGIKNLMEYALGLSGTTPNGSPGSFDGSTLSFNKGANVQGVTYAIETSSTLNGDWVTATSGVTENSNSISFAMPQGSGKLFARLKVSEAQ